VSAQSTSGTWSDTPGANPFGAYDEKAFTDSDDQPDSSDINLSLYQSAADASAKASLYARLNNAAVFIDGPVIVQVFDAAPQFLFDAVSHISGLKSVPRS
jgi:hypothetical protein